MQSGKWHGMKKFEILMAWSEADLIDGKSGEELLQRYTVDLLLIK